MATRYFILGGGIAGLSAAQAIRENDPSGLIVLLTNESSVPYSRPALTKSLLTNLTVRDLAVQSEKWYDAPGRDIVVLKGRTVTAIDPEGKTITTDTGLVFPYDKLIFTLGARCFVPPIPGADRPNVVTIRTFEDVERVRALAKTAKTAAVIGGGVLGLEAASSLAEGGLKVTVLEHGKQIMSRQIDAEAAAFLASAMEKQGVTLRPEADSDFIDDAGVHLKDGAVIPADIVIISAGVRANLDVAKAAGIETARHITVDDHMRTSVPDIYAAGDCACFTLSYALWTEAEEMGRVAGENAAGVNTTYTVQPRPVVFHGFGTALFAFGDCGKTPGVDYTVGRMPAQRYYMAEGRTVGAILEGDLSRMDAVTDLVLGRF